MSNIIILSLIGLGIVTSFSFIYSAKQEIRVVKYSEIKGSENLSSKIMQLGDFNGIAVYDQVKVILSQGNSRIEILAEDNLLEHVRVKNEEGELQISIAGENKIVSKFPITVKISNPTFRSIKGNHQSEILIDGSLTQSPLNIRLEDQCNLRGQLELDSINLELKQQSNAYLNGNSKYLNLVVSDQSGIKAGSLNVEDINAQISGQTDATLNAIKSISGNVRDNASLKLESVPEVTTISKSKRATMKID